LRRDFIGFSSNLSSSFFFFLLFYLFFLNGAEGTFFCGDIDEEYAVDYSNDYMIK
jgi:hypothetical protein